MADPLSTTVGILSFIIQVSEIAKDAKDAKDDWRVLLAGLDSLKFLIEVLKERLEDGRDDSSWSTYARRMQEGSGSLSVDESDVTYEPPAPPQEAKGPLAELYRTIAKIAAKLKPPETGHRWESVKARFRRLGWKWEKGDFQKMLMDIARAQGQVSFILDQDEHELLRSIKVDTRSIKANAAETLDLVQEMKQAQDAEANRREMEIIESWLSPLDFTKRIELGEDSFPSGKGLLESCEFKQWVKGQKWYLWCYGKPRSGKSILSSIIAGFLQPKPNSQRSAVACVFFDWEDPRQEEPQNLLGSLFKQLLQQDQTVPIDPDLIHAAAAGHTPRVSQIEQHLIDWLESKRQDRVYFILDGWDQCKPEVQVSLRESFERLRTQLDNLNIMYTTRLLDDALPDGKQVVCSRCGKTDLKIYFHCKICDDGQFDLCCECWQKSPTCKNATHELFEEYEDVYVNVDTPIDVLEEYVELQLNKEIGSGSKKFDPRLKRDKNARPGMTHLGKILQERVALRQKIPSAVGEKAEGCFLHAKLFVDALRGMRSGRQIEQALKEFPINLDDVYQDAIKRIQRMHDFDQNLGLRTLRFLACASRPPSLGELQNALAAKFQLEDETELARDGDEEDIVSDEGSQSSLEQDDIDIWKEDILKATAGLIDISQDEDTVRLSHFSIRTSLIKDQSSFREAQKDLAIFCLDFLKQKSFSKPSENDAQFELRRERNPFIAYASQNWARHVQETIEDESVRAKSIRILQDQNSIDSILQAQWNTDSSPDSWDLLTGLHGLHICARFGLHALIPSIVQKIGDINVRDREGHTPLMYACREGYTETIERLLDLDAAVDVVSQRGRTALFEAIFQGHLSAVNALLDRQGIQLNINQAIGELSETALMIAVAQGRQKIVARLLKCPNIQVNWQSAEGHTALMTAAINDHVYLVQALLATGNAGINLVDTECRSALHFASLNGYTDIVKILLQDGADPDLKDSNGNNAFLEAIDRDKAEAAQTLFNYVKNMRSENSQGRQAIHLASEKGWVGFISALTEQGADPNAQDKTGLTPMHYAASKGFVKIVEVLIENGAASTITDASGKTPADFAAAEGFPEVLTKLGNRYDLLSVNRPPLWRLAREGGLTRGEVESRKAELCETEPITQNSAIHCAAQENKADVLLTLLKIGEMNPNLRNRDESTPLLIAADCGNLEATQVLLKWNANPDLGDRVGNTPLSLASDNWPLDIAVLLIEAGAAMKQRQEGIQRLFFGAVGLGSLVATEALLRKGADPLQRHEIGMTAQQIARERGSEDLVRVLREAEKRTDSQSSLKHAERLGTEKETANEKSQILTQQLHNLRSGGDSPSTGVERSLFQAELEVLKAPVINGSINRSESSETLSARLPAAPTNDVSTQDSKRIRRRLLA